MKSKALTKKERKVTNTNKLLYIYVYSYTQNQTQLYYFIWPEY